MKSLYLSVYCPSCGANAGEPCRKMLSFIHPAMKYFHITRKNKYEYEHRSPR